MVIYIPDVRLTEEARIEGLTGELITLLNQSAAEKVLLSFRNVKFMGSAMIGKIIQLNKKCKEEKIDFRLCEMNDNLMEVFRLMKLDKIITLYKTEQAAVDAFAGKKKGWFG
jgi:anti-sigma B factor antagonist